MKRVTTRGPAHAHWIGAVALLSLLTGCPKPPVDAVDACQESCFSDDPCQVASCDSAGECLQVAHPDAGVPCDDGDACTTGDTCAAGTCGGAALSCKDGNSCTDDTCGKSTGCKFTWVVAACEDDDACTAGSSCLAGDCVAAGPVNCDDGEACTADKCDPKTGCLHPIQSGACEDGDPCTAGDSCDAGACAPGNAAPCDDDNVCTTDDCDPKLGCQHGHVSGDCDDEDACTLSDACTEGTCVGEATDCDDDDPCTDQSCESKGGCLFSANTAACDDGSACTSDDGCDVGQCKGTTISCADGNPCTGEGCESKAGCTYVAKVGGCDDGNPCTTGDVCKSAACLGLPMISCDDGNACTQDLCTVESGCSHKVAAVACEDGDDCTSEDHCEAGSCVAGPAVGCDDCGNGQLELMSGAPLPACKGNGTAVFVDSKEALEAWVKKPDMPILIGGHLEFGGASLSVATGCRMTLDQKGHLSGLHHLALSAAELDIEGWIEAQGVVSLRGSNSLEFATSGRIDAPAGKVIMEAKTAAVRGRVGYKDRLSVEAGYLLVDTVKTPGVAALSGLGELVLRSIGALTVTTTAQVAGPVQFRAANALKLAEGMSLQGATNLLVQGGNVAMHGNLKASGEVTVQVDWNLQFAPKAMIHKAKSVTIASKGAAQISGQVLEAGEITIDAAGALYLSSGAILQSTGPATLKGAGDVALHGALQAKGKQLVMAESLTLGKSGDVSGAAEVEFDVGGPALSTWAGTVKGAGDLFFKGSKLHMVEGGSAVSNSNLTFVLSETLLLDGLLANNGDVFMSAKQFSVGATASFKGNTSCVIAGEPSADSAPLKGCKLAL